MEVSTGENHEKNKIVRPADRVRPRRTHGRLQFVGQQFVRQQFQLGGNRDIADGEQFTGRRHH